jgi:predicted dehydrogenase
MDKVRFGIIGLGNIGTFHASYLNDVSGAALTAVSDFDPKRAAAFNAAPAKPFANYQEMLDSGLVDAVIIATPHYSHEQIATAAFARNIHVLCEKPITVTIGQARRLNEAHARAAHLKFGVVFQYRLNPVYQTLRGLISQGRLGPLSRITWLATDWFRPWAYFASSGWRATWAGEGGGVVINQCIHNLDLLYWLTNMMPQRVTAVASIGKTHPIEVEDEVSAILEYASGAVGHFVTATGEAPGTNRLEICGDRGRVVAEDGRIVFHRTLESVSDVLRNSQQSFPKVPVEKIDIPVPAGGTLNETHRAVVENFVRAVLHDEPLVAPGPDGAKGLEIGNAMLLSGLKRKGVDLPIDSEEYEQFIQENIARYGGRKTLATHDTGPAADLVDSFKH